MTTLNKILDYYQHYIQAKRMYLELVGKRWVFDDISHLKIDDYMIIGISAKFILKKDFLDKLYALYHYHVEYQAIIPEAVHTIEDVINRINKINDIPVNSVHINKHHKIIMSYEYIENDNTTEAYRIL